MNLNSDPNELMEYLFRHRFGAFMQINQRRDIHSFRFANKWIIYYDFDNQFSIYISSTRPIQYSPSVAFLWTSTTLSHSLSLYEFVEIVIWKNITASERKQRTDIRVSSTITTSRNSDSTQLILGALVKCVKSIHIRSTQHICTGIKRINLNLK